MSADMETRRRVLGALTGAAFAGAGLVLAMPPEAPATTIEPAADAELVAACEAMKALWDRNERYNASATWDEEESEAICTEWEAVMARLMKLVPRTEAGLRAKAAATILCLRMEGQDFGSEGRLALNCLTDVAGRA